MHIHIHIYRYDIFISLYAYTHIYKYYLHLFLYCTHVYTCVYLERGSQATNHLNLVSALCLTASPCLLSLFKLPANTSRLFPLSRLKHLSVMALFVALE